MKKKTTWFNRISLGLSASKELGLRTIAWYVIYKAGLKSGVFRRFEEQHKREAIDHDWFHGDWLARIRAVTPSFKEDYLEFLEKFPAQREELLGNAEEILQGYFHPFGGEKKPIILVPPAPLRHWSEYEKHPVLLKTIGDLKFPWEVARFGWAFTLFRAYTATGDDRYARYFWERFEHFSQENPPYLGVNWISGQEAALRLLVFTLAVMAFIESPESTPQRIRAIGLSIFLHAARIPHTIAYAKAQANNHLVSESLGLLNASLILDHPYCDHWKGQAWDWLKSTIQDQVFAQGEYTQHSMNYQRLFLQLMLYFRAVAPRLNDRLPDHLQQNLIDAAGWVINRWDETSGHVPNYGHHDGAYVFPLAGGDYNDYSSLVQALRTTFFGYRSHDMHWYDEYILWLSFIRRIFDNTDTSFASAGFIECMDENNQPKLTQASNILHHGDAWGCLTVNSYKSRPAHADQLHFDLWWHGYNLALDAGTYLYNALPPWENALSCTAVHNTIQVDNKDQMQRVGRFLWLDWAQAHIIESDRLRKIIIAEHDGYSRIGIVHRRMITAIDNHSWRVEDLMINKNQALMHQFVLQWLVPDWEWDSHESTIFLKTPDGDMIALINRISANEGEIEKNITIVRAGICLFGNEEADLTCLGWYSPTYAAKEPALSIRVHFQATSDIKCTTTWILPH